MTTGTDYLLIVEDDPDIRKFLDATLTFRGYRVVTARNGQEALDIIELKRPVLVIADIMMPRLDGFGLVHRIRINPATRDLPVVFITATYVAREDRAFALTLGATRFIQKPVDIEYFLATINELVEEGLHPAGEPLDGLEFYSEYRKRLQLKLEEKNKQIAREERLLATEGNKMDETLHKSLRRAIHERDELQFLLQQIHEHLEKYSTSE